MTSVELMKLAEETREKAYAPYSKYRVGAALLCKDGTVYTGCNVESSTFTPTSCAERTALFQAIKEGKRKFEAIAICGGLENGKSKRCAPCGVCRQALSEFCKEDFKVILGNTEDGIEEYTLGYLLPFAFTNKELQ